jgi:hypothetical protein
MEGGKTKQVLDGVVSGIRMMGEGGLECLWKWEEMKSAEQWCFSIGKKVTSVPHWCFSVVKNQQCCTAVFQHRENQCESIVNSAAQQCFSIVKACLLKRNRPLLCFDPAKIDCRTIFLDRDY